MSAYLNDQGMQLLLSGPSNTTSDLGSSSGVGGGEAGGGAGFNSTGEQVISPPTPTISLYTRARLLLVCPHPSSAAHLMQVLYPSSTPLVPEAEAEANAASRAAGAAAMSRSSGAKGRGKGSGKKPAWLKT